MRSPRGWPPLATTFLQEDALAESSALEQITTAKADGIRFVQLQFTDILGHRQGRDDPDPPARELGQARDLVRRLVDRGLHPDRRVATSTSCRTCAPSPRSPGSGAAGPRGTRPRHLRRLHAARRAVRRRPALRPAPPGGAGQEARLHRQHGPRARVLPLPPRRERQGRPAPARPGRLLRLLDRPRPGGPPGHGRRPRGVRDPGRGGPPRGRRRPARDRLRVRRRARARPTTRSPSSSPSRRSPSSTACTRRSCPSRSSGSTARACTPTRASTRSPRGATRSPTRTNKYGLSDLARSYMAGILAHARGMIAVLAPTVNSYKRLVPGYEAPTYITWGRTNRSALIRVPMISPGKSHRGDPRRGPLPGPVVQHVPRLRGDDRGRPRRRGEGPRSSPTRSRRASSRWTPPGSPSAASSELPGTLGEAHRGAQGGPGRLRGARRPRPRATTSRRRRPSGTSTGPRSRGGSWTATSRRSRPRVHPRTWRGLRPPALTPRPTRRRRGRARRLGRAQGCWDIGPSVSVRVDRRLTGASSGSGDSSRKEHRRHRYCGRHRARRALTPATGPATGRHGPHPRPGATPSWHGERPCSARRGRPVMLLSIWMTPSVGEQLARPARVGDGRARSQSAWVGLCGRRGAPRD